MLQNKTILENNGERIDDDKNGQRIIVMGASGGGLDVFKKIIQGLPADFNASVFVVWHMAADLRGILPDVFNKVNTIYAANAYDNEEIKPNRIYVAPPDHHLLIEEGRVRVTHGPKENRFRPAIDPLFRSAAYTYGNRVIGVLLTGALDDGTAGLWRIKNNGGIAIVQDPDDAEVPSMPASALREVEVDYTLPASAIAGLLTKLSQKKIEPNSKEVKDEKTKIEIDVAAEKNAFEKGSLDIGEISPISCPDCHGVLSKIKEGNFTRFRCHTGHAYSQETLMALLNEQIEDNLYIALRSIDENVLFLNHLGDHFAEANQPNQAGAYFKKAKETAEYIDVIRNIIVRFQKMDVDKLVSELVTTEEK